MTVKKPTTVDTRTALTGTPRRESLPSGRGASPRRARENAIREAVNRPEFRHDNTEVKTTASIPPAAPGRPIVSSTATYGLFATLASFHGIRVTTTAIDPM